MVLPFIAIAAVAIGLILFSPWLKGWRTQMFSMIVAVGGGLLPLASEITGYLNTLDWTQYVAAGKVPWMLMAIGIISMVLRFMTTGPTGSKS